MKKLITLGSRLSYSDLASKAIIHQLTLDAQIFFEPSIDSAFKTFKSADFLVLPIENAIDGYIQRTLDLLYKHNYFITNVIELPVDFSLVSNVTSLDEIQTVYVQFKAKNQCLDFLENLAHVKYITTDSNTESLDKMLLDKNNSAAIIPKHLIQTHFLLTIHNIHDRKLNHTRFALIEKSITIPIIDKLIKAMLSITPKLDQIGLLYDLLKHFKNLDINLSSIISRPRMEKTSPYHFFLEIDTLPNQLDVLLKQLQLDNALDIKILGVY
jgi:prephenate dehydratase